MTASVELAYNDRHSLDLWVSEHPDSPILVYIHGGGFHSGDKRSARQAQITEALQEQGISWASINYELAEDDQNRFDSWPTNICDVFDAFAFLAEQQDQYGYDMSRLGIMGCSAGCCLAGLYTFGGERMMAMLNHQRQWIQPKAFVGFYGPFDCLTRQRHRRSGKEELDRDMSPAYWLRQHTDATALPPVLHIHGDQDELVILAQHEEFQATYTAMNGNFTGIIAKDFGHAFSPLATNAKGDTIDLRPEMTKFLLKHLS